ncbi:MAG: imidazolonepropionase [Syntrophorhabdaceae bacterium]|nr:imidazolonepropionase [Syntrophorhabdaceae bacterium]
MAGDIIIKNVSQLVTVSGFEGRRGGEMSSLNIVEDGAVVIEGGIITRVGRTEETLKGIDPSGFTVIDGRGRTVLPGFVDSHTHFVFGGYREKEFALRLQGASYMDILAKGGGIISTVKATRSASKEELIRSGLERLDTMLSLGVTTVEGKSGYGLDLDTELKQLEVMAELDSIHPVDVVSTFLGAHAVPEEFKGRAGGYIDFIIKNVLPVVSERGLAEFCDVFCEKGVFGIEESRRLLEAAKANGLGIKIHADEITHLGGAELASDLGATSGDHLLYTSYKGIEAMAKARVVATLLPLTAFSLKEPYARARFMIDKGCTVALATDFNPGSSFTMSIPLVFALATLYMGMTPEEVICALTINGAAAINRADKIGSIDVGKKGDIVVLKFPSYLFLPYYIAMNPVETVVKEGEIVVENGIIKHRKG